MHPAARLSIVQLAESVHAGRDENDRLAAFNGAHTLRGFDQRVKEIRFRESGGAQPLQGLIGLAAIFGEVGEDLGPQIVGDHGHPVLGAQGLGEAVGGGQGLIPSLRPVLLEAGVELDQQANRHRGLREAEAFDLLRDLVFEDEKVPLWDSGDEAAFVIDHRDIDVDQVRLGSEERRLLRHLLLLAGLDRRQSLRLLGPRHGGVGCPPRPACGERTCLLCDQQQAPAEGEHRPHHEPCSRYAPEMSHSSLPPSARS